MSLLIAWMVAALAAPEDPGPYPAGWRDVSLYDAAQGWVPARISYPALASAQGAAAAPATGPYPLVGLQHGWLGDAEGLHDLAVHVASHGFVVVATDTNSGLFPDTDDYARDTSALLHAVERKSADAGHWLFGMASGDPWSAVGHSMGGQTLAPLIGVEPRIEVIVGMQPAGGDAADEAAYRAWTGASLFLAGSMDLIVPPGVVYDWFALGDSVRRNVYLELVGGGHTGPTNTGFDGSLSHAEQHAVHRRLVTAFLQAEVLGDEDAWAWIVGDRTYPLDIESASAEPVLWTAPNPSVPGAWTVGLAGWAGFEATARAATSLVAIPTPIGLVEVDPAASVPVLGGVLGPSGLAEATAVPPGPVWVQGAQRGAPGTAALTRTVLVGP